jgi:hypothetical protein
MNMVQIMGTYMYVNAEMIPVETVPRFGGGGTRENSRGGEFKYDTFDKL